MKDTTTAKTDQGKVEDNQNLSPENKPSPLPLLIDFTISLAKILVIIIGMVTALVSIASGATVFMATLRSAAAMLAIGLLLWLANWMVSRDSLRMAKEEMVKESQGTDEDNGPSTIEKTA